MNWNQMNKNKWRIILEVGLAFVLVLVIGIAGWRGLLSPEKKTDKHTKSKTTQTQESSQKAAEENKQAKEQAEKSKSSGTEAAKQGEQTEEQTEEVIAAGQYPIMGKSSVTVQQMVQYFESSGQVYPSEQLTKGGADSIQTFCQIYYDEAISEGVRPEVAFVQTMKETGWLQYGGDSSIEQFNFAGLGTTGGGVPGNSFPDVKTGVRAQIQHLKAYATTDPLAQACVDERYEFVAKGSAPYVEWLGQKENPDGAGWATAVNYGYSIVDMISKLKNE